MPRAPKAVPKILPIELDHMILFDSDWACIYAWASQASQTLFHFYGMRFQGKPKDLPALDISLFRCPLCPRGVKKDHECADCKLAFCGSIFSLGGKVIDLTGGTSFLTNRSPGSFDITIPWVAAAQYHKQRKELLAYNETFTAFAHEAKKRMMREMLKGMI